MKKTTMGTTETVFASDYASITVWESTREDMQDIVTLRFVIAGVGGSIRIETERDKIREAIADLANLCTLALHDLNPTIDPSPAGSSAPDKVQ